MKKIFFIFLIIYFCLCYDENPNNWQLVINEGNQIVLTPGIFTKTIIQLNNLKNDYLSEDNEEAIFYLSLYDNNEIFFSENELILNTTENLVYSTYLGLKCENSIQENINQIEIKIKVRAIIDSKLYNLEDINLYAQINRYSIPINLDILLNSIPEKTFNLFKLKDELYNVDDIILETKIDSKINNFELKNIVINQFLKREILSEDNPVNHGILFDYPFGSKKSVKELDKNNFKIEINFQDNKLNKCFSLVKKEFDLNINNRKHITINEEIKKTIKDYIEDQTKQCDKINSLKIKTFIPIAPAILTCEFKINSENLNNSNNFTKIYKNFITREDNIDIIVNNLEGNEEYYAFCELANTNFDEENKSKINISIGNFMEADKVLQLIPSKDYNRQSQCAKFTFEGNNLALFYNIQKFKLLGTNFCYFKMKQKEPLLTKGLPTVICQPTESDAESVTICVAPLTLYNLGNFFNFEDKENFDNSFNEFIEETKSYYYYNYFINLIKVEKIVDKEISRSSINAVFVNKTGKNPLKLYFNIFSSHKQLLECYYNKDLNNNPIFNLFKNSIELFPEEINQLEVEISSPSENNMYSLNFECYNKLPSFNYRYKTTGIMTMYTYLYSNTNEISQSSEEKFENTTIDCYKKENLLNPRCLKDKIISIYSQLKTDIPEIVFQIENQSKKYAKMLRNTKDQFLLNLQTEIQKNYVPSSSQSSEENSKNIKSLFEKVIEITNYLTYTDCSIYASGSSNREEDTIKSKEYVNCRLKKQDHIENIIKNLKRNLNNLKCSTLIDMIISGLGNDAEENLKYVLIMINELSNNPESYRKGLSQVIFNISTCIQERFDEFWPKVEKNITDTKQYLNFSIAAIKKDATYIILQTLTNLAKIIHYDEIDGYINGTKTKTGLLLNEKSIQIQKKIIEFSKKLNEFGDEHYSLSGSLFSKVETNKNLNSSYDIETKFLKVPDKNILIKVHYNYMLRNNNAKDLQILVFDSPLVSVKSSENQEETSDSVNTFISIILYNEKGEEIPINSIDEKYRPEILYLKSKYENLKKCYYYNEEKKELVSDGIIVDENFEYNGKKYFKCVSEHLTAFTAGTYNFNSEIPWYAVAIIISIILLILMLAIFIFIIAKRRAKKRISESEIISSFKKGEGLSNNYY